MPFSVTWSLLLRVRSDRAAAKVLRCLGAGLGPEVTTAQGVRYWKDPALLRVVATTPLGTDDPATAVFETLRRCGVVARRWTIGPLQSLAHGRWQLDGSVHGTCSATGVHWAAFKVRNYEPTAPSPDTTGVEPE